MIGTRAAEVRACARAMCFPWLQPRGEEAAREAYPQLCRSTWADRDTSGLQLATPFTYLLSPFDQTPPIALPAVDRHRMACCCALAVGGRHGSCGSRRRFRSITAAWFSRVRVPVAQRA